MTVPSLKAIGQAVVMTAISLVIINWGKQYLPDSIKQYL